MRNWVLILFLIHTSAMAGFVCEHAAGGHRGRLEVYDSIASDGSIQGNMVVTPDGPVAYIDNIRVEPQYRRQGISTELFRKFFLAHPEIEIIHAELMWTNLEALYGLSREDLLREFSHRTPFVRSLRHFGFTRVTEAVRKLGYVWIEIRK